MRTNRLRYLAILIISCLLLSACQPTTSSPPPTDTAPASSESFSLEVELLWPTSDEGCQASFPAPTLKLCLTEDGAQSALLTMPAALLPGLEQIMLGTLPGGSWSAPMAITLEGLADLDLSQAGIIIVNTNPAPDAAAAGIIIVNTAEGKAGIIVVDSYPQPGTAEGIIIIEGSPAEVAQVGLVSLQIPGLEPGQLVGDQALGGHILSIEWLEPLESAQQLAEGIVWGGLVAGVTGDFINASPFTAEIYFSPPPDDNVPPPDDNKTAIVWGGMPTDAAGIIIINNLPGPDQGAEGIIIVHGKDISQVMGIIMEDKPAAGDGSDSIIIVNSKPAEFNTPGFNPNAVAWVGKHKSELGKAGIIIVDTKPAEFLPAPGLNNFGFPEGFGLPENMMPFMNEGGYGPGPFAFLGLDLAILEPATNQENCYLVDLAEISGLTTGGSGFTTDSFFDDFTNLTVGVHQEGADPTLITQVVPIPFPGYVFCTPEPGDLTEEPGVDPAFPTATAEKSPLPPTATTRTGLPTTTPTPIQRLPTETPGRSSGD